jgi:hypothetical protein
MVCSISAEAISFSLKKSERYAAFGVCVRGGGEVDPYLRGPSAHFLFPSLRVKRKAHALGLLSHIVQHARLFFLSDRSTVHLLRFFVAPTLTTACVTDVPSVFRLVCQTFLVMWQNFKVTPSPTLPLHPQHHPSPHHHHHHHHHHHFTTTTSLLRSFYSCQVELMAEMGIFLDRVLLQLLEAPSCSPEQKKEIIGIFAHILQSPKALVNLFYNYDADYKARSLFGRFP